VSLPSPSTLRFGAVSSLPATGLATAGVAGAALVTGIAFGAALPLEPVAASALLFAVPLAFGAPVAALALLLLLTVVVPFDAQNRMAFVGGEGVPGLLVVDLLLLLGLLRVAVLVATGRLRAGPPLMLAAALGLVVAALLLEGLAGGADLSDAGHEARRLGMGVGAFIIAWPLLEDNGSRRRLWGLLLALGSALGAWGLAQWLLAVDFTAGADVGVRPGVDETSAGRGQLQGGLYAFPVAVTLSFAALVSGRIRSPAARWLVVAVLLANGVCLVLTYERTFWAAAAIACLVVALRSGPRARRAALGWVAIGAATLLAALMVLGESRTATERLLSVAAYSADESLDYRKTESRSVAHAIAARPLTGWGLGASITWGEDGVFATQTTPFSHNGYLWLAWKMGVPAALALIAVIVIAVFRAGLPSDDGWLRTLRMGSQAALLALLLVGLTFPPFNAFGITAAMGVMVALCLVRPPAKASPP
jgi:O-antigen ligase/polysaccharide polymerase Wzy-like membrane protein